VALTTRLSSSDEGKLAWLLAIVLGLVFLAGHLFAMNPDGISYLRISDLYRNGEWSAAVNAYWSPLYPLLLAAASGILHPTAYWEAPVAHMVNFACYLAAFAAFRYLLRSISAVQDSRPSGESYAIDFRRPAEWACAYVLFFVTSLMWVDLERLTPDMLLAAVVFAASGLALRLRGATSSKGFAILGVVVALGYLVKAVMFPLGILFLILAAWTPRNVRRWVYRLGFAIAGFTIASAPQIASVSRLVGHLSYSETGMAAYAREVNGFPTRWIGEPAGSGVPVHPVTRLTTRPAAYVYPVADTHSSFPLWDTPAHWVAGIRTHFDSAQQLAVTMPILDMYLRSTVFLLFAIAILLLLGPRRPAAAYLPLVLTGLAAFALYAMVFAELRYLGAWMIVVFLGVVCAMRFRPEQARSVRAVVAALALFEAPPLIGAAFTEISEIDLQSIGEPSANVQLEIASRMHSMGIVPGDRVGLVGYAFDGYWARLGGIQIAGDVPQFQEYWSASDPVQRGIDEKFREAGMVAVIANRLPKAWNGSGWNSVGLGTVYVKPLAQLRQ
jgi:hypothetical protein